MKIRWMVDRRPTVHGYTRPNSRDLMLHLWQIDIEADTGNGVWAKWGEMRIDGHQSTRRVLVKMRGREMGRTDAHEVEEPKTHEELWSVLDDVITRVANEEGWEAKTRR